MIDFLNSLLGDRMKLVLVLKGFFKAQWLAILAIIVGFSTSYYFYSVSKIEKEPAYVVTNNVGLFSSPQGLSSEYFAFIKRSDNSEVVDNVYLLEASFWNMGREPIRAEDVLDEISINYIGDIEIIDAFIAKATRTKIINPELKINEDEKNILLNFRILEEGDVIGIQIIYSAKEPSDFTIDGAILGVKSILTQKDLADENLVNGGIKTLMWIVFTMIITAGVVLMFAGVSFLIDKVGEKNKVVATWIERIIAFSFFSIIAFSIILVIVNGTLNNAKKGVIENIPKSELIDR